MNRRLYSFGPFQLNASEQLLLRDGQALPLKPKVFDVLAVLVENSGRVVCKDELMKQVWPDSFVEEGNLAVSIFEIRKVLGGSENGHRYIETVPRRGYRFVACVAEADQPMALQEQSRPDDSRMPVVSAGYPSISGCSIAVLPFRFIGATGNEHLGLGMADALITRLSNLRQMTVRSTSAVRKYNGSLDSVAAGKELGVEWVLDGSVQKSRTRIRVTVQLVRVGDGGLMWGDKFEERFADIFAVEDSISEQVAKALEPRLTVDDKKAITRRYTQSVEAYDAYLKGRFFFDKRSPEGLSKGIEYFNQAIVLDPKYALAYTGLADSYNILHTYIALPLRESDLMAERALLKALELDPQLAEAHASLGHLRKRQWDWASAELEFKKALELNANYAIAHAWFGIYLALRGQSEEALIEIEKAQRLDPLSVTIAFCAGSVLYLARMYEPAVQQFRRALELDPEFAVAQFCLGNVREAQGRYEEAASEYRCTQSKLGRSPEVTSSLGRIQALLGKKDEAQAAIDELLRMSADGYVQPIFIAVIYSALGDKDRAYDWLERAYDAHDGDLCMLGVDPRLDNMREDPRFMSLLQRIGLGG
jgi:DNA-binding winged helix-turn-helix (wHTH) protein/tetratricopeptide (TPR) repeat protein